MKKKIALILLAAAAVVLSSCSDLKRNNPYDPGGSAYRGVTYKGDISYPDSTSITAMIYNGGGLCFGAYDSIKGDCVIKMAGGVPDYVGTTGDTPGHFRAIQDICADAAGNIYVVDNKNIVQVVSTSDSISSWNLTNVTVPAERLFIACYSTNIYVTSSIDKKIFEYSETGSFIDSLDLSSTAYGPFTPGREFVSGGHVYVVNADSQDQIIRLTPSLAQDGLFDAGDYIYDASFNGAQDELISSGAVYNVDESMVLSLKWGNFGTGPGIVLDGKLIACDPALGDTYVLDGRTIKRFGE
jgi:hypothetical protein